jgi:CRP-like cAMP-binding protein
MRLDDIIDLLKGLALFRSVDPEALRLLAFSAVRRQLRAGDILFRRGEAAEGGFLVISGEIVLDQADNGSPSALVFGPGTLIGQMALFTLLQRPATAIARDSAVVLVFTRELMLKVLDAHPRAAMQLREALGQDVRDFAERMRRAAGP